MKSHIRSQMRSKDSSFVFYRKIADEIKGPFCALGTPYTMAPLAEILRPFRKFYARFGNFTPATEIWLPLQKFYSRYGNLTPATKILLPLRKFYVHFGNFTPATTILRTLPHFYARSVNFVPAGLPVTIGPFFGCLKNAKIGPVLQKIWSAPSASGIFDLVCLKYSSSVHKSGMCYKNMLSEHLKPKVEGDGHLQHFIHNYIK